MTRLQPGMALDRLIDALEAEILAAPEPEVRAVVLGAGPESRVTALRALVMRAVEEAEQTATLPPPPPGAPALRRP
jgi:hypothetical protein